MTSFITHYGYIAVFLLMLVESACIPIPSEVIMTFAGAVAAGAVAHAHLSLAGVVVAGVLGNVAGSYVAWAVGKYAGLAAVRRWGRRAGIREHEIDRATNWFERHGPAAVLIGRVVPVIRTFISLPAGFAGMPAGRFGLYTTLGCIPWTAGLAIAGYAVGANYQSIANAFHGPTYVIAAIVIIALAVAVFLHFRRSRNAANGPDVGRGPGPGRGAAHGRGAGAGHAAGPAAGHAAGPGASGPGNMAGPAHPREPWDSAGAEPSAAPWPPPGDRRYR